MLGWFPDGSLLVSTCQLYLYPSSYWLSGSLTGETWRTWLLGSCPSSLMPLPWSGPLWSVDGILLHALVWELG